MLLLSLAVAGCQEGHGDTAEPPPKEILALGEWRMASLEEDPFPSHQPEEIICPVSSFRIESGQLEVEMDLCNYALLEFSSQQFLAAGTEVELLLLHTGLWAPFPGKAHACLLVDGEVFFEVEPNIPASAEFFFHETALSSDIKDGATIQLHIHGSTEQEEGQDTAAPPRHGANDWRIGYFNRKE